VTAARKDQPASAAKRSRRAGGAGAVSGPHSRIRPREPRWEYNTKALHTKQVILDAARVLFLERGYSGTRIENITTACGLSRGAFYAYFGSKLEVFDALGTSTYKRQVATIQQLANLPHPCDVADVRIWVEEYFRFMAEHGAFMFSAGQAGPDDPEFHARVLALTVRTAERFGSQIQRHTGRSDESTAGLGLVAMATLERSWYFLYAMQIPVELDEVLDMAAEAMHGLLEPQRPPYASGSAASAVR
jgi:AcrR family transcriptional regulator